MGHKRIPFAVLGGREKIRWAQQRIEALESNIEYYEKLALETPVGEDGVSPYQPILHELYNEVSNLEFALACPATAS